MKGGFHKRHEDVSKEDLKQAVKNALESIRRKAKLRHWQYIIYAVISNRHMSRGGYICKWHAHIILYGTPCYVIAKELKSYWTKHGYANSIPCKLQKCWNGGKIEYNRQQESASLFQKVNATQIIDSLGIKKVTKKNILDRLIEVSNV
jgi:hypothetical protein